MNLRKVIAELEERLARHTEDHAKKNIKGIKPGMKDMKRLEDIKRKAGGDDFDEGKVLKLVRRMAEAITDLDKAIRRGEAAKKVFPGKFGQALYDAFTMYV